MRWRKHENRPMIAAGEVGWRNQIPIAALLVCLTLLTAACSTNFNNDGNCDAQGGNNRAGCNGPTSMAVSPSSTAGSLYSPPGPGPSSPARVSIAAGSEDLAFLTDPQVLAEFARKGLSVDVTGFGSGQLANTVNPDGYDAFFLSSQVFADMAELRLGTHTEYHPFTTPLMVFTWKKLVPLLQAIGVVNGAGQFDIRQYLKAASSVTPWDHIPGNTFYANPNQVLLEMTDPAESDSGAMFVAAAGYVIYVQILHKQMVYSESWVAAVAPAIAGVIGRLGEMPPTTNDVYLDYRRGRMNGTPLALGYESEWKGAQPATVGALPADAVSLPLDFPVNCEHVVVAFSQNGKTFGYLLETDPVLQNLARKYGFQTGQGIAGPGPGFVIPVPDAYFLKELIHDVVPHG
jgi:hypothetical protein